MGLGIEGSDDEGLNGVALATAVVVVVLEPGLVEVVAYPPEWPASVPLSHPAFWTWWASRLGRSFLAPPWVAPQLTLPVVSS